EDVLWVGPPGARPPPDPAPPGDPDAGDQHVVGLGGDRGVRPRIPPRLRRRARRRELSRKLGRELARFGEHGRGGGVWASRARGRRGGGAERAWRQGEARKIAWGEGQDEGNALRPPPRRGPRSGRGCRA